MQVLCFDVCNLHRATARAMRATESQQKAHFRSKLPQPKRSDPPKRSVEGLRSMSQISTAPQRERSDPPKSPQKVHVRCSKFAPRRSQSDPMPKVSRLHFRCSNFAPRRSQSDPTCPKSAEGSRSTFKIRTASQPERSDLPKVCRGFTFDVQTSRCARKRNAEGLRSMSEVSAATQRERSERVHFRCYKIAPRYNQSEFADQPFSDSRSTTAGTHPQKT